MPDFYFCKSNFCFAISTNSWFYLYMISKDKTITYGTLKNFDKAFFCADLVNATKASIVKISAQDLVEELRTFDNNDLIYTGAGISKKAGIPVQKELESLLYLDDEERLYKTAICNPSLLISKFRFFVLRMTVAKPTESHYHINRIVTSKKCRLVTENLDFLHEKAGTFATHVFKRYDEVAALKPNRVCLIGIGKPYFQSVIKKWNATGTKLFNIALEDTYINGVNVFLLRTDLHDFFSNHIDVIAQ